MEPIRYFAKVLPDGHLPLPCPPEGEVGKIFEVILMPLSPGMEVYDRIEEILAERHVAPHTLEEVAALVNKARGTKA